MTFRREDSFVIILELAAVVSRLRKFFLATTRDQLPGNYSRYVRKYINLESSSFFRQIWNELNYKLFLKKFIY